MPDKTLDRIRKKLAHSSLEWAPVLWLDTKVPELNAVIGHRERGIPYGRIIEISGMESSGKSALSTSLAGLAQQDGAQIVWIDLENSWQTDWAIQRGITPCPTCKGKGLVTYDKTKSTCTTCGTLDNCSICGGTGKIKSKTCLDCEGCGKRRGSGLDENKIVLLQPYVGKFGKEKSERLSTGPELLEEAEEVIQTIAANRLVVVLDSIPSILTEGEIEAGLTDRNMRTKMELPMFLSALLRRWVGMAQVHNSLIIMINQLRQSPQSFGDPWYTMGGNAPRFFCHIRVRVRRTAKSKIISKDGKFTGIRGIMKATKNKSGGIEGAEVGYKLFFSGAIEFLPAKDLKDEVAGEE